jgi:hypothetical protein
MTWNLVEDDLRRFLVQINPLNDVFFSFSEDLRNRHFGNYSQRRRREFNERTGGRSEDFINNVTFNFSTISELRSLTTRRIDQYFNQLERDVAPVQFNFVQIFVTSSNADRTSASTRFYVDTSQQARHRIRGYILEILTQLARRRDDPEAVFRNNAISGSGEGGILEDLYSQVNSNRNFDRQPVSGQIQVVIAASGVPTERAGVTRRQRLAEPTERREENWRPLRVRLGESPEVNFEWLEESEEEPMTEEEENEELRQMQREVEQSGVRVPRERAPIRIPTWSPRRLTRPPRRYRAPKYRPPTRIPTERRPPARYIQELRAPSPSTSTQRTSPRRSERIRIKYPRRSKRLQEKRKKR